MCGLMALCACLKIAEEKGCVFFFFFFSILCVLLNLFFLSSGKHLCVRVCVCATLMEKQSAGSQSQFRVSFEGKGNRKGKEIVEINTADIKM